MTMKSGRRSRALLLATNLSCAWAVPGQAQTVEALEARLEAQAARIRGLEARVEQLSAAAAAPRAATSTPAVAPPRTAASGEPTIKLRGRAQVDMLAINDGDGETPTGTQVRRFYLGAEGKIAPELRYQAEADFAGNKVSLQDVLVGWQAAPSTEVLIGYFKPQITQDDMTSDVHTLFLERSAYAGVFAPGRRVGVGVHYAAKSWGVRGGVFGEREDASLDVGRNEGWVASLRGHADLLPGDDVLHVALSSYYTKPSSSDHLVSLSQKPETNRAVTAIGTGNFLADDGYFVGGELALGHGPLLVQAEGGTLNYHGPLADPRFSGWSAQASWRITGEARSYDIKSGQFGRVTPARPWTEGGWGALEAGLRVTHVDLEDDGIMGGTLTTYGGVLNWYPVKRLRIGANLIHAAIGHGGSPDAEQTMLTLRGAIDW